MNKTMMIAAMCAFPAVAAAYDAEAVRTNCEAQWPNDFFMQKGCIDLQRQSFDGLPSSVNGLPEDIGQNILQQCKAQWPGDFFMQKGCTDLQAQSWRDLNN